MFMYHRVVHVAAIPGRIKGWYRFGALRDCSPYWKDFLKCMKFKVLPEDEEKTAEKKEWLEERRVVSVVPGVKDYRGTLGVVWEARDEPPENWMSP